MTGIRVIGRSAPLLAALAACGPPPAAPAPPSPKAAPAEPARAAGPATDPAAAQKAAKVALDALSKRNFDVAGCAAAEARLVPEAEARAGVAATDQCAVLAARAADGTWLVVVRSTLSSKSVGAQARVTVTPSAEGLGGIEYAK